MKYLKWLSGFFATASALLTHLSISVGNYSLSEKYGYSALSFGAHAGIVALIILFNTPGCAP